MKLVYEYNNVFETYSIVWLGFPRAQKILSSKN